MKVLQLYTMLLLLALGGLYDPLIFASNRSDIQQFETAAFDAIDFSSGFGRLYLVQGDKSLFKIDADSSVHDQIQVGVKEGTLKIEFLNPKNLNTSKPIKFFATTKEIKSIVLNGHASLQSLGVLNINVLKILINGSGSASLDIHGKNLELNIAGSGSINIKGEIDSQFINIAGSGSYEGQGLFSKSATVDIHGSGEAIINTHDQMNVKIYGSGIVRYKNKPEINSMIEGSGSVVSLD